MANTVNVIKASSASDFEHHNVVQLCGRIVGKKRIKRDELKFTISCGRGNRVRKNKEGKILRDVISVTFFNDAAEALDNRYEVGDFVTVNGVAQNVRDHYHATNAVTVWGIYMGPKYVRDRMIPDRNKVNLRGKVTSSSVVSKDYIIINVLTVVDKERRYMGESPDISKITNKYRSVTPVGIRCNGNANEMIKNFTEGTYVDVYGFVDTRTVHIDEGHKRLINRIFGIKVDVVGDIQPAKVKL